MKWLHRCAAAFRFLTIFPLPSSFGCSSKDLAGSTVFFPFVGLVLGVTACGGAWLCWQVLPPAVAAVACTLLLLSFSGALHLDGLADSADGLFSARDRKQILLIMRDSRIGTMGVAAVVMLLMLKISSLASLNQADAVKVSFLMPVAGRCALVVLMTLLPYIRPEGGLGSLFYSRQTALAAVTGVCVLLVAGFLVQGVAGLGLAGLVLINILIFSFFVYRKIGGATGDILGAGCEISETAAAVVYVALAML